MTWLQWLLDQLRKRPVPPPMPTPTPTPHPAAGAMVAALNVERARSGLSALSGDAGLDADAATGAADMARTGTPHIGFPGRVSANHPGVAIGEDVAWGQTSVDQVVARWMNSPPHRAEILNPSFRWAGVGTALDAAGRTWWCVDFSA